MTYSYEQALARRAADAQISTTGGSGYFAARADRLDPALFVGDNLRPDVRGSVLHLLWDFWAHQGYIGFRNWSRLWLAGSGITTAWSADRETDGSAPGDLDTMVGIDYDGVRRTNRQFAGSSDQAIGHFINQQMFDHLWPRTARTVFNGTTYEVTYYVNSGVSARPGGVMAIGPYAAYDLNDDTWTVHPNEVPEGFSEDYFSADDRSRVAATLQEAQAALQRFERARANYTRLVDPGKRVNAARAVHDAVRQGAAIYDRVHDGRHAAFGNGGAGYLDPANYAWQAAKGNGTISITKAMKQLDEQAHRDEGTPEDDVQHLLLTAALAVGGS